MFVPLLKTAEIPVALHVDGVERRRAKWGLFGRAVYALSERLATSLPDALITDARVIQEYFLDRWSTTTTVITYGVDPVPEPPGEALSALGIEPQRYFLYVSRFEPENNPHQVVEAYRGVDGDFSLVMVGDAPYAGDFIRDFTAGADPRVIFPGSIYGRGYRELLSNASAYVHATEVGGTHPALVEAMGYGNCVVVNDTPENREVASTTGIFFRAAEPETLTQVLDHLRLDPARATQLGALSQRRATEEFSWDVVVDEYLRLFDRLHRQ